MYKTVSLRSSKATTREHFHDIGKVCLKITSYNWRLPSIILTILMIYFFSVESIFINFQLINSSMQKYENFVKLSIKKSLPISIFILFQKGSLNIFDTTNKILRSLFKFGLWVHWRWLLRVFTVVVVLKLIRIMTFSVIPIPFSFFIVLRIFTITLLIMFIQLIIWVLIEVKPFS